MSKRRLLSVLAAAAALFLMPAAVSADPPPGTITIIDSETGSDNVVDGWPTVCEFAVEIDFEVDEPVPLVAWVIKVWNEPAFDGETVLSGEDGPTDDSGWIRQPRDGWVTLPDGQYNLLVDDETPVDKSFLRQRFVVDCDADVAPTEAPTVAPTEAPTEAPTVAPTETPTETPDSGVLPTQGVATETPGGQGAVLPTQETTLPPTDTGEATGSSSGIAPHILGILLLLSAAIIALTPARRARQR